MNSRSLVPAAVAVLLVACGGTTASPPSRPASSTASAALASSAPAAKPASSSVASVGPAASSPAGSAAAKPSSGAMTVVKVGVAGRPDQVHFELGLRNGLFAKQGLDVQEVPIGSGQDMVPALAQDQLQVGSGSPSAGLYNAFNRDINIPIVGDWGRMGDARDRKSSSCCAKLMVSNDLLTSGAVKTLADLKGKTLTSGPSDGSIAQIVLYRALEKGGLTVKDVNSIFVGYNEAIAAMSNKKLDGGILFPPLSTQAEAQGIAKVFASGADLDPGAEVAVLMYSPGFAKQTDVATRFMTAYVQAIRDYYDAFFLGKNQDQAIGILTQYLSVKDPKVWKDAEPQNIDLNGRVNVDDLKAQAEFYAKTGSLKGGVPNMDKFVDMSFVEAALKQLGPRQPTADWPGWAASK